MCSTRSALATITAIAATAALAPAAAQAVPPSLGPPSGLQPPGFGKAKPPVENTNPNPGASQPTPPPAPTPPITPPDSPKVKPKLLLSKSSSLKNGRILVGVRCTTGGRVTLKATGPGRVTGTALGSAAFRCRSGRGLTFVRLPNRARGAVKGVSVLTADVSVRMAGKTQRQSLIVSQVRRGAGHAANAQYWTSAAYGVCGMNTNGRGSVGIRFSNLHWNQAYWRAWLLVYTDAGGTEWVPYYRDALWRGPFGYSPEAMDAVEFTITPGYDLYVMAVAEVWSQGSSDWNYARLTSPTSLVGMYGDWCHFA